MRWKSGGRRDTGHDCVFVGNRLDVIFVGRVLVRALHYEVKASVFAACGELSVGHAW